MDRKVSTNWKSVIGLSIILIVGFQSCKEDRVFEPPVVEVPDGSAIEKKVLIEPTVSISCGACPLMHHEVKSIEDSLSGVIHMNHYLFGPLHHPFTTYMMEDVNKTVYTPLAHVNRNFEEGSMVYYPVPMVVDLTRSQLESEANYGIHIEAKDDDGKLVIVSITPRDETYYGSKRLHVFIVEKSISEIGPGYDQRNYGNDDPSHPYFRQGNYIEGFEHTKVIREVLTSFGGDTIEIKDLQENTLQFKLSREGEVQSRPEDYAIIVGISEHGERLQPFLNVAYAEF